jgi:2-oxo-4-hydroxy-4-carboxy--5-ureidoimidazoline (OHCU) decarboxylase
MAAIAKELLTVFALQLIERANDLQKQASVAALHAGIVSAIVDYGTPEQMETLMKEYVDSGKLIVPSSVEEKPS